jgi:hypothetical protein
MPDGLHWYCLATAAITGFEEGQDADRSYIVMRGVSERLLVPVSVAWLDRTYAEVAVCPIDGRQHIAAEASAPVEALAA